jgi:cation diffusion facilitator family transporter
MTAETPAPIPAPAADDFQRSQRTSLLSVVANAFLVVIKLVAGVLGNSYALIADAIESALDILGSLVVWGGIRYGARPADEDHPYGHGKAESLAALVIAISLLGAAIGLAIQSVRQIVTPAAPPRAFTLVVLVGVIVTKELLFRFVSNVSRDVNSTVLRADAWHHRSDALTSLAAFAGILVTVLGGEGYESADAWAALFACAIIAFNGVRLLRPAMQEIMDAAADPELDEKVRELACSVKDVITTDECRVRKYGLRFVVDLHVVVDGSLSVRRGHEIAHQVKDTLLHSELNISDVLIHIEPADEERLRRRAAKIKDTATTQSNP